MRNIRRIFPHSVINTIRHLPLRYTSPLAAIALFIVLGFSFQVPFIPDKKPFLPSISSSSYRNDVNDLSRDLQPDLGISVTASYIGGQKEILVEDFNSGNIEIISRAPYDSLANGPSSSPVSSADGKWIAFESRASNLVSGDNNTACDIFLYQRDTKSMRLISKSENGSSGNGDSYAPALSSNGRWLSFLSYASNLVPQDTNHVADVYQTDTQSGQIKRISINAKGFQINAPAHHPSMSADGRFIAYSSSADNLIPFDSNSFEDVFIYDQIKNETILVSIAKDGAAADADSFDASISPNGCCVAFISYASNLTKADDNNLADLFVRDFKEGKTYRIPAFENQPIRWNPSTSTDGRFIVTHPADINAAVYDRQTGQSIRLTNGF